MFGRENRPGVTLTLETQRVSSLSHLSCSRPLPLYGGKQTNKKKTFYDKGQRHFQITSANKTECWKETYYKVLQGVEKTV